MQFPNPIVNRLVIYGSADGLPDVTIGPSPLITFYDGADIVIRLGIFDASTAPRMEIKNTIGHRLELGLHPVSQIPRVSYTLPSPAIGEADIWFRRMTTTPLREALEIVLSPETGSTAILALRQNAALTDSEIVVSRTLFVNDPVTFDTETWHTATPAGAWTGIVQYRLLPDGDVIWRGSLGGGATAVGTPLISAIPGAWCPKLICRFETPVGGVGAGGRVQIDTAGNCVIAATPSIASVWFDPIRYSTIT